MIKDRSTLLDGQEMADPDFKFFLPHVKCLKLGGKTMGADSSRTSAAMIPAEAPRDRRAMERQIMVDEINDLLLRHDAAGTSAAAQKKRSELMTSHFGTASKTAIEEKVAFFDLRAGYESLHQELEKKPSKFVNVPITEKVELTVDLKDGIPDAIMDKLPATNADPFHIPEELRRTDAHKAATDPDWVEQFVS